MDYSNIKVAVVQAEDLFTRAAEQAKTLILNALTELVIKYPYVKSVSWTQGPSGFNDGEPEYFMVCDLEVTYALDTDEDVTEFVFNTDSPYEEEKTYSVALAETFDMSDHDTFEKELNEVNCAMQYSEEIMKRAFGEYGQKITVYGDRVDYEEWYNY